MTIGKTTDLDDLFTCHISKFHTLQYYLWIPKKQEALEGAYVYVQTLQIQKKVDGARIRTPTP